MAAFFLFSSLIFFGTIDAVDHRGTYTHKKAGLILVGSRNARGFISMDTPFDFDYAYDSPYIFELQFSADNEEDPFNIIITQKITINPSKSKSWGHDPDHDKVNEYKTEWATTAQFCEDGSSIRFETSIDDWKSGTISYRIKIPTQDFSGKLTFLNDNDFPMTQFRSCSSSRWISNIQTFPTLSPVYVFGVFPIMIVFLLSLCIINIVYWLKDGDIKPKSKGSNIYITESETDINEMERLKDDEI
eukprot:279052_1